MRMTAPDVPEIIKGNMQIINNNSTQSSSTTEKNQTETTSIL